MSTPPVTVALPHPVSGKHQQIFDLLLNALQYSKMADVITLRVAGGWVRNMLLGIAADDIDIAVEGSNRTDGRPYTGQDVANMVLRFQQAHGLESRSIGIIHSNPEKSKHLESATTHIYGEAIDFVHLRSENYATDSRIPDIEAGTMESDALRRDFTVNALYYNIHTRLVEDYVGGMVDLERSLLRCPMEPKQTFLDDPLRMLRAVRFAPRLNLKVCEEILHAARSNEVQSALTQKVSRERVGTELGKAFAGSRAATALQLLVDMKATDLVFRSVSTDLRRLPGTLDPHGIETVLEPWIISSDEEAWLKIIQMVTEIEHMTTPGEEQLAAVLAVLFQTKMQPLLDLEHHPAPATATTGSLFSSPSPTEDVSVLQHCASCIRLSLQLPKRIQEMTEAILISSRYIERALSFHEETWLHMYTEEEPDAGLQTNMDDPFQPPSRAASNEARIARIIQPAEVIPSARTHLYDALRCTGKHTVSCPPTAVFLGCWSFLQGKRWPVVRPRAVRQQLAEPLWHVIQKDEAELIRLPTKKPLVPGDVLAQKCSIPKQHIARALRYEAYIMVEYPQITSELVVEKVIQNKSLILETVHAR